MDGDFKQLKNQVAVPGKKFLQNDILYLGREDGPRCDHVTVLWPMLG